MFVYSREVRGGRVEEARIVVGLRFARSAGEQTVGALDRKRRIHVHQVIAGGDQTAAASCGGTTAAAASAAHQVAAAAARCGAVGARAACAAAAARRGHRVAAAVLGVRLGGGGGRVRDRRVGVGGRARHHEARDDLVAEAVGRLGGGALGGAVVSARRVSGPHHGLLGVQMRVAAAVVVRDFDVDSEFRVGRSGGV